MKKSKLYNKKFQLYYESIKERDPALKSVWELFLYPSFIAISYHRLAHRLYKSKWYFTARLISQFSRFITGIEIHPGAVIGKYLFIDHGMGVVIGETAIIGNRVTMFHGVTLGGVTTASVKRHPTVEDGVIIGAGSTVLGNITIGTGASIGASSVVLKDVDSFTTVVGNPARVVAKNTNKLSVA